MKEKGIAGIKELWDTEGSGIRNNGLEDYNLLISAMKSILKINSNNVYEEINSRKD